MLQILQPTTGNLVAVNASGTVTAEDYEGVLIPAIEETLKSHDKVRVLFQLDPNTGFTAGAVWDDTKFGLSHFFAFEKFALVSDTEWINNTVKVLGFVMPCPVKLFALSELEAAREWVSG
ncbi:MAG: STAS/SEC14 domain-containing protein [Chromatiaceae bacterium]|nr:STAS/SEC14 domain-containing protein [Chromatiaceae bacterium]